MKVCLAANAVPRKGGQGVNLSHMISGLDSLGYEKVVFQAGDISGMRTVRGSRLARGIGRVPLLRRKRNWIVGLDGMAFDRHVAHNLPRVDVFQGVTGQCHRALVSAAKRGVAPLLDSVTAHIADLGEAMDRSCRQLGVVAPLGNHVRGQMRDEYRLARRIRVMSDVAARSFERNGVSPDRVFVVRPWVDLPGEHANPSAHEKFRISFVGLIEPWKGIATLLDAYSKISDDHNELLLFGNSGSRAIARLLGEARAGDPSVLMRSVDVQRSGFESVYGQSSVLVHPSLSDGFGLVVLEAMATGIPVIVSSAAGAADIVEDGVDGYVVPPGEADAIADRLQYLMDHPEHLDSMGRAARKKAATRDLAAFCAEYERFLNDG